MKNTYTNAYELLCESNKHKEEEWKPVGSGLMRHRINPGHNGGEYIPENCTYLTLQQHTLAHWLLWKIHGRPQDHLAYSFMSGIDPKHYPPTLGKNLSEETRAKMSAARRGKKHSKETLAKMSAAKKGKKLSEEQKAKLSAVRKGRKITEETRAKISASLKGRKLSKEHCAKISANKKGKKQSKEHKAKIAATKKGKKLSEETRAKMSAYVKTAEHKAKLSAARKGKKLSAETIAKREATKARNRQAKLEACGSCKELV